MVTTDAWSNQQCQNTRQKANRTRDSICRTLSPCSKQVKTRTYARLHLTRVRFKGMESAHCKNWSTHLSKYMYKDQRLGLSLWLQENNILISSGFSPRMLPFPHSPTRRTKLPFPPIASSTDLPVCLIITSATYFGRYDFTAKFAIPTGNIYLQICNIPKDSSNIEYTTGICRTQRPATLKKAALSAINAGSHMLYRNPYTFLTCTGTPVFF